MEPIVVQRFADIKKLKEVDGGIFAGGGDINYRFYSANPMGKNADWRRDAFDYTSFCQMGEKGLVGICRGAQIINVFCGGTLTDLKNEYMHISKYDIFHLMKLGEKEITVNSMHHQAIKRLANGFKVLGVCGNVIELAASTRHILCQFHPERMNFFLPLIYLKKVIKKQRHHIIQ